MQDQARHFGLPDKHEELKQVAVAIFNRGPGQGVAFLVAAGLVRDFPVEINQFLCSHQVSPEKFGDFLGEEFPLAQNLRLEILNSMSLLGKGVVSALETVFRNMAVPSDYLRTNRLVRSVAHFWWLQHEEEQKARSEEEEDLATSALALSGEPEGEGQCEVKGLQLQRALCNDTTLHGLLFSTLMLHQWLRMGHHMTLNEWIQMNANLEVGGSDIPMFVQTSIYSTLLALSGRGFPSESKAPPKEAPAPTLEGLAHLHYNGRAQVSHNGIPAEFPVQQPRLLAARGGVSSAGRSSCAHIGGLHSAGQSRADSENGGVNGLGEEVAWLTLHRHFLFFEPAGGRGAADGAGVAAQGGAPQGAARPAPYAFVSLRRAVLRVVDADGQRLVLASRSTTTSPMLARCDEWLDLCLLLADGRFQPLEAPRLQLRFDEATDFEKWAAYLGEACTEPAPKQPPVLGPRITSGLAKAPLSGLGSPDKVGSDHSHHTIL